MFPDVAPEFVLDMILKSNHPEPDTVVCNYLLENPNYPRVTKDPPPGAAKAAASASTASSSAGSDTGAVSVVITQHFIYNSYITTVSMLHCITYMYICV